jgi:hypothetical protein
MLGQNKQIVYLLESAQQQATHKPKPIKVKAKDKKSKSRDEEL